MRRTASGAKPEYGLGPAPFPPEVFILRLTTPWPSPPHASFRSRRLTFFLSLIAVIGGIGVAGGAFGPPPASAFPLGGGPTPSSTSMFSGDVIQVTAFFNPDDSGGDDSARVSVLPTSGSANLTLLPTVVDVPTTSDGCVVDGVDGVIPSVDDADCLGTLTDSDGALSIVTLTNATVEGIDGNATGQTFRLIMSFTATCASTTTYTFTGTQGGVSLAGGSVTCSPPTTPTVTPVPTRTPFNTCDTPGRKLSDDDPPACSVVVTANPNVVPCGGVSVITASVRDRYGHVIPGFGFHFSTSAGVLTVGTPSTADAEQAIALLQILPGMSEATVLVSVGLAIGTVENQVTVQQFCPSYATTTGNIQLKASSTNVPCGGSVFIAATARDVSGNVVPDGTELKFITTSGKVTTAQSSSGSAATAATPQPGSGTAATTQGGTLNVVYTADSGVAGLVTITAAGGASFGSIDLQVCGGGATVAGRIGITPPNTGDGGLVGALAAADD